MRLVQRNVSAFEPVALSQAFDVIAAHRFQLRLAVGVPSSFSRATVELHGNLTHAGQVRFPCNSTIFHLIGNAVPGTMRGILEIFL